MPQKLDSADAPWLARVHAACFPSPWSEQSFVDLLKQQSVFGLGVRDMAFGLFQHAAEDMEVLTIAVHPTHRRQGLALGMMEMAMEKGYTKLFLDVAASNTAAIKLYERLGFAPIRTRKAYYSNGEDAVVMQRATHPPQKAF
jgi:[ribosomal protein S18]-alanine N-acetyltransferase